MATAATNANASNQVSQAIICPLGEIAAFVKRMTSDAHFYMGTEKRTEARYAISIAVNAFPINHSYEQTGQEFVAVTRDISTRGLALLHTQAVTTKWLAIEAISPQNERIRTVIEVLRCRAIGPLFEIAGKFVTDLNG